MTKCNHDCYRTVHQVKGLPLAIFTSTGSCCDIWVERECRVSMEYPDQSNVHQFNHMPPSVLHYFYHSSKLCVKRLNKVGLLGPIICRISESKLDISVIAISDFPTFFSLLVQLIHFMKPERLTSQLCMSFGCRSDIPQGNLTF